MSYYFLESGNLQTFFNALTKKYEVISPVQRRGIHGFYPVNSSDEVDLNFGNTIHPPKRYFLPNSETLFKFRGDKTKKVIDDKKRLIFGIRVFGKKILLHTTTMVSGILLVVIGLLMWLEVLYALNSLVPSSYQEPLYRLEQFIVDRL